MHNRHQQFAAERVMDNATLIAQFIAAAEESPRRPASANEVRDAFTHWA